jgi:prepilin-type N-terminal cleavage/methylation domain-containing protein
MLSTKGRRSPFTLVEILVVIAILAILAVVTVVVIDPIGRINQANDATIRDEVANVADAVSYYIIDNAGTLPTHSTGTALPAVTAANVMTTGAEVVDLDGMTPDYLPTLPDKGYRLGVLNGTTIIVGGTLSDGSAFTVIK